MTAAWKSIFIMLLMHAMCYGQTRENKVNANKDSSICIDALKMSILYVGVDNPIKIAGGSGKNINVTIDVGTLVKVKGNYFARVPIGKTATISVFEESNGKSNLIGSKVFRIKNVPDPHVYIAGKTGFAIIKKTDLKDLLGVVAVMEDFDFDILTIINSFDCIINGTEYKAKDNLITSEMKSGFKNVKDGDLIIIKNVQCKFSGYMNKTLRPVVLKVSG